MADSDDLHSIAKEPDGVVRLRRLTHHIQRIREDQHAMRAAIERMSEAVTRLALVEERPAAASTAIERLVQSIERLGERLRRLEVAGSMQAKSYRMGAGGCLGSGCCYHYVPGM